MENNKFNVLSFVISQRSTFPEYEDELVFSDIYRVSFHTALRAIAGKTAKEKAPHMKNGSEWIENEWILEQSSKACDIRVINFDRVIDLLNNNSRSCDAFFYNFFHQTGDFHFIAEFKNTDQSGKRELLRLLNRDDQDGIYRKVKESVENIRHNLHFGGTQEADEIIQNMHFFVVYNGKNNAVTSSRPNVPSKKHAQKDAYGKQNRATRTNQHGYSQKEENEIYQQFDLKIEALGMKPCTEDTFPGNAIPRLRKAAHGSEKVRYFTIFSAQDFGDLLNSGFFDDWSWGPYLSDNEDISGNN